MFFLSYFSSLLLTGDAKVVPKFNVMWPEIVLPLFVSSGCEREAVGVFNMGPSSKLGELIFFMYLFVTHSYKHSSWAPSYLKIAA